MTDTKSGSAIGRAFLLFQYEFILDARRRNREFWDMIERERLQEDRSDAEESDVNA